MDQEKFLPIHFDIKLRNYIISELGASLKTINNFGADYFGYRYFQKDGASFGFTTNDKWYESSRSQEEILKMTHFFEQELEELFLYKRKYIMRTMEPYTNSYLESLKKVGMSNSLGIYKTSNMKVEHFFFICKDINPNQRGILINNIKFLEEIVQDLLEKIPIALDKYKDLIKPELYLNTSKLKFLAINNESSENQNKNFKVNLENKNIYLTKRELDILCLVRFNSKNTYIAKKLDISVRTVEDFIKSLKYKFELFNRTSLVNIANEPSIKLLYKKIL